MSTIFCMTCKSKSFVYEPFFDLQLPLVSKDVADAKPDDESKDAAKASIGKAGCKDNNDVAYETFFHNPSPLPSPSSTSLETTYFTPTRYFKALLTIWHPAPDLPNIIPPPSPDGEYVFIVISDERC